MQHRHTQGTCLVYFCANSLETHCILSNAVIILLDFMTHIDNSVSLTRIKLFIIFVREQFEPIISANGYQTTVALPIKITCTAQNNRRGRFFLIPT